MGNPNSKLFFPNNPSIGSRVDFLKSNREMDQLHETAKEGDVLTTFVWKHGGKEVGVTGSFNKWKKTIPLKKNGDEFSITIPLPRGVHQYKFIVDNEWRFAPEGHSTPDCNGNINNEIDTRNFEPIKQGEYKESIDPANEEPKKMEAEANQLTTDELPKIASRLPVYYQQCTFLQDPRRIARSLSKMELIGGHSLTEIVVPNDPAKMGPGIFQQTLTQSDLAQLFTSPHCLAGPSHVEMYFRAFLRDHVVNQKFGDGYESLSVTRRFQQKFSTYRMFSSTQGARKYRAEFEKGMQLS